MLNKVVFSKSSDNWKTPSFIYDFYVVKNGFKDLFPFQSEINQYDYIYKDDKLFINPPYSHLNKKCFRDYMTKLINKNNYIVLLIPSRTDTKIFQYLLSFHPLLFFISGRLKFNEGKSAPFPSCIMNLTILVNIFIYPFITMVI